VKILIIVLLILISGCSGTKIAFECPKVQLPPDPVLATSILTSKSQDDEIIKAWVASAASLKNWNRVVRAQLN
jgi:hypothetical protein